MDKDTNKYILLRARIIAELNNLNLLEEEIMHMGKYPEDVFNNYEGIPMRDVGIARIAGGVLSDYYSCIERIFYVIATKIDGHVPEGKHWHADLLEQMWLEVEGVRTQVISKSTKKLLNEFRGFRHVFRGVYDFDLDTERIFKLVEKLSELSRMVYKDINKFITTMDKLYRVQ